VSEPLERLGAALSHSYRVERELGQGGMATVYLAQDLKHDRKVAIKVLRPELAAVIGAERFLSEIKTTANLQHPHILPLHDSGQADSFLFYVMPFVPSPRKLIEGARESGSSRVDTRFSGPCPAHDWGSGSLCGLSVRTAAIKANP
jgi:serine/threonine protein kinase